VGERAKKKTQCRRSFIIHPDVVIDPHVPVPDWPLNERGRAYSLHDQRIPRSVRSSIKVVP
jgi:hypothetical protein